jgi:hypothetical protein
MRRPITPFEIAADRTHVRVFDASSLLLHDRVHEFSNRLVPDAAPIVTDPKLIVWTTIKQLHKYLGQKVKYPKVMQQVCAWITPISATALFLEGILLPDHFDHALLIEQGDVELLQLPPIILGGHLVHPYVRRSQWKLEFSEGDVTM